MRLRNAGSFNRRIFIQAYKEGHDEEMIWVKDWVDYTKAMAMVKVKRVKVTTENDVEYRERYTEMMIRQNKVTMGIETGMRVIQMINGIEITYRVDDIDYQPENNQFITLKCVKESGSNAK